MHLFYHPDLTPNELILDEEESKHCIRVLRMQKGDETDFADGQGTHAIGLITDDHPKHTKVKIIKREQHQRNWNYHLHLALAPTKNFDKTEWFLEKAVEAGINEISFIETTNTVRSKINMERCEKIAISAMKQSKQWHLPVIHPLMPFTQFMNKQAEATNKTRLMAWCETPDTANLITHLPSPVSGKMVILIGPEGDFTADETAMGKTRGFTPVSLGKNILRTETAALYVCMAVKALAGA